MLLFKFEAKSSTKKRGELQRGERKKAGVLRTPVFLFASNSLACLEKTSYHFYLLMSRESGCFMCSRNLPNERTGSMRRRTGKWKQDSTSVLTGLKHSPFKPAEQLHDSEEWHSAVQTSMGKGTKESLAILESTMKVKLEVHLFLFSQERWLHNIRPSFTFPFLSKKLWLVKCP